MDPLEYLHVRFHYNGEFLRGDKTLTYAGGTVASSFIKRDSLSSLELTAHLKNHLPTYNEGQLLYWQYPERQLFDGLKTLVDDEGCKEISDYITDDGVAEIFVEPVMSVSEDTDGNKYKDETIVCTKDARTKEVSVIVNENANKKGKNVIESSCSFPAPGCSKKQLDIYLAKQRGFVEDGDGSSSDSEYMPGDNEASDEDDEAIAIKKQFKEFKKKMKSGKIMDLDDLIFEEQSVLPPSKSDDEALSDASDDTPYYESSDDEASFDEQSDGELVRRNEDLPRYNSKTVVPCFALGMRFRGRKQFRRAIIKHGLAEKRAYKFLKNDSGRVRVKCTWPNCPWVMLLSKNTRTSSWQISTFRSDHMCPPRRDNKLVTARRIAEKYEKMIRANPTWKMESLQQTVQEEMLADVSISKCKRAKKIVIDKLVDAINGEYARVFDYQAELLRSNPGSTVIVKLDPDQDKPVFQRFYVCFAACKRGFMAGCRRVVGLDGCFFKGGNRGELLCALGRDSNNQMYPLAWAVVEKENNDTWDWFCSLLFGDIQVGDGESWVFISDQQKGIINAVKNWAPRAEHRNCARHIYANWRKTYRDKEWQKNFWRIA
jgi:hypothetical protein